NLEPEVMPDQANDPGWANWRWMKNYRVWEAALKVFMWPENYLLYRDDATELFKTFQGALQHGDVTNESAEDAFADYLEGLDRIARLEVAGLYHQDGSDGRPDVLHVFARTQATPPIYYYRQWIGKSRWTAWERVPVDIPEKQIVPVVWNRRLYLFWPIF